MPPPRRPILRATRGRQTGSQARRTVGSDRSVISLEFFCQCGANADILTFAVTDHDPEFAKRLAEDYATAYTQYRRQLDTAAIASARRGIEAQLAQLKASGGEAGPVYANLFEKDQELSTLQALQGSNAMIVRSAGRAVQTQPKPLRNGVLAAMLGLLLGIGLVFLRDALNTRSVPPPSFRVGSIFRSLVACPSPRAACGQGTKS